MGIIDNIKRRAREADEAERELIAKQKAKENEKAERITQQNKDNYYNNIAYIAEVMVYVKFVAIVTIIMWALSAIGIFIVFAQ